MTSAAMVAYAGATWDWHRLHHDQEYARHRGLDAPLVDGQLFGALFVKMLQDWLGPDAFLTELALRFREPVLVGETVRCKGVVTASDADGVACDLRAVVIDDHGNETRVAVAPAHARVSGRG
jgi:acyl dehydratase